MKNTTLTNILLLCISVFLIACNRDRNIDAFGNNERCESAEYNLNFGGGNLVGEDVEALWKIRDGRIWLSTDDRHTRSKYGTLTLILGEKRSSNSHKVIDGALSTTNKLKGTSAELDPKRYDLIYDDSNWIEYDLLNDNCIRVTKMAIKMQRVKNDGLGETITLRGTFTATTIRR